MSRTRPTAESSSPMEERQTSTDLRAERVAEREIWILPEGFTEIDMKVILEVEYFLPEKKAGV